MKAQIVMGLLTQCIIRIFLIFFKLLIPPPSPHLLPVPVTLCSLSFFLFHLLDQVSQLVLDLPSILRFMMMSGRSRYHFTAAQWQELEQQALFFKLMVSGLPIPPELLFSINGKTSFISPPPHIGWSCFEMGLSSKVDPEPTRCRRTDGKKWRCSRQVFGDSKYCERHMHRGKTRSRRPLDPNPLQLQAVPLKSSSSIVEARSQSNLTSLSSITSDRTRNHVCNSKPVKDSNFMTFLGIDPCWSCCPMSDSAYKITNQQKMLSDLSGDVKYEEGGVIEKRQRTISMFQFIEESPQEKRDSWLNLVI